MTAKSLRHIEQSVRVLADDSADMAPDDMAHALRVIAAQIGAQAEMMEQGLTEVGPVSPD